jgi:hypothetical protein
LQREAGQRVAEYAEHDPRAGVTAPAVQPPGVIEDEAFTSAKVCRAGVLTDEGCQQREHVGDLRGELGEFI